MQLPQEIELLQRRLNSPSVVEGKWYRRNHGAYELVSYINNLGGLLASDNLDGANVFLERTQAFLEQGGGQYVSEEYATLVQEYLQGVAKALSAVGTPNNSFKADA